MLATLDWLTLRTRATPRSGRQWFGSVEGRRFVRPSVPGLDVKCLYGPGSDEVGEFVHLVFPGEFFRAGGDWREASEDVLGSPLPPCSATRVDVVAELPSEPGKARVREAAEWLVARLGVEFPRRNGWMVVPVATEQTNLCYVQERPSDRSEASGRSRPLFWRVYQRLRGPKAPSGMRVELERKQFSEGMRNPGEAVATAAREFELVTHIAASMKACDGQVDEELDARQAPAKLLRQAWGLVCLAAMRQSGMDARQSELERDFGSIVKRIIGRPIDLSRKVRRKSRGQL